MVIIFPATSYCRDGIKMLSEPMLNCAGRDCTCIQSRKQRRWFSPSFNGQKTNTTGYTSHLFKAVCSSHDYRISYWDFLCFFFTCSSVFLFSPLMAVMSRLDAISGANGSDPKFNLWFCPDPVSNMSTWCYVNVNVLSRWVLKREMFVGSLKESPGISGHWNIVYVSQAAANHKNYVSVHDLFCFVVVF